MMKDLFSLVVALRREVRERDDVQILQLLELVALVLDVPIISVMWPPAANTPQTRFTGSLRVPLPC